MTLKRFIDNFIGKEDEEVINLKKWLKFMVLPLIAVFLVACGNQQNEETPVENAPVEDVETTEEAADTEQTAEGETPDGATESETTDEEASDAEGTTEGEDAPTATHDAQGEEGTATVAIYQDGEVVDEYTIENIGGISVLDAMSAVEDLEFNFNETEGVIDSINGVDNDYDPNTWMYLYNGGYAELGVVSQTLEDGDEIDWYFGTIDDIPVNIVPAEEAIEEPAEEPAEE